MQPLTVEDAIIAKLKAGAEDAYYVERFEGAAGSEQALREWIAQVQLPAVAVCYAGAQFDTTTSDEERKIARPQARFEVWVISDKFRGYETAMVEPGGIHETLNKVYLLLQGNKAGVAAIEPLTIFSELPWISDDASGRVVWVQTWETSFIRS